MLDLPAIALPEVATTLQAGALKALQAGGSIAYAISWTSQEILRLTPQDDDFVIPEYSSGIQFE